MAVALNHTIVHAKDARASATFFSEMLGLPEAFPFGPFLAVPLEHGLTFDFMTNTEDFTPQHYAFLVTEEEFDAVHQRILEAGLTYWADPVHRREGAINRADGGRGLCWLDPNGHSLEVLTVPYGGWPS